MLKLDLVPIGKKVPFQAGSAAMVLLLLAMTCRGDSPESPTGMGIDLLSVRAGSSEPLPHDAFNETVAKAKAAGETWVSDPIMVVRRFADWGGERQGVWVVSGTGERPSRYEVVAIADGFLDDSVRGERLDVSLEMASDQSWRIAGARVSWRCWPGRGHETYSTDPCD